MSDQGTAPRRVMRVRGVLRVRRETALGFVCLSCQDRSEVSADHRNEMSPVHRFTCPVIEDEALVGMWASRVARCPRSAGPAFPQRRRSVMLRPPRRRERLWPAGPATRLFSGSSQGSVQLWPVPWLISQALSSTYVAGEHRLYLERNCRLSESPAHGTRRKSRGACQCQGAEQSARVRPSGKTSAKVQAAFHECSWFVAL